MATLNLTRVKFTDRYTMGVLSWDGHDFCETLEDVVRKPGVKVKGQTAIPPGTYEVRLTYSYRFKKVMPQLMNVPMFEGIRIHAGNTEKDTEGCILVGRADKDRLVGSREVYDTLVEELTKLKEPIYITIT